MMNGPLLSPNTRVRLRYCGTLALLVLAGLGGVSALAAELNIGQQIKAGLVPPVLVKGEPPTLTPLAARMSALHVPAVSIAVIHEGKLVWAGGFGTRSPGGPPVTVDTLFQAGSISKPVTAAAVMTLVQSRQLDLDADINLYLKSWKLPQSPLTDHSPVTLRELLSHSGGVNNSGFGGFEAGQPVPTLVQVLNGEPPAKNPPIRVEVAPGTIWRYSGGGYVIAQQVLIDVTGTAFPQLMRERVLVPFGMSQSTFEQPLPPDLLARAAIPYDAYGTPVKGGPHVYPEMAPAGLWTTASDLARFAIGIQRALAGLSGARSQAAARAMLSPVSDGVRVPFMGGRRAGHGLILGGTSDRPYFEHHGGNLGYSAYVMAYDSGDGAAIMVNTSNDDSLHLIDDIVRTIARAYEWPDFEPPQRTLATIAPARFDRYVGAYRSASGELVIFWRDGHHLESRLHQNGNEQLLTRLEDREGRTAVERSIEMETRIKGQTPAPGGEQALLELIAGVVHGNPHYDRMTPQFAQLVRQELSGVQRMLGKLGPVQSASFKRVLPDGRDLYDVTFQHGSQEMEILMAPDGRIHGVLLNR